MAFQDSKTFQNLQAAAADELQACGTYHLYAKKAELDGFEQIKQFFLETAQNESAHASVWLTLLNHGDLPDTLDNLIHSFEAESRTWELTYKDFARTARAEGFPEIADLFEQVATVERHHDYRFRTLATNLKTSQTFCRPGKTIWICTYCGFIHVHDCAPNICPVCKYPQGFYQENCDNY